MTDDDFISAGPLQIWLTVALRGLGEHVQIIKAVDDAERCVICHGNTTRSHSDDRSFTLDAPTISDIDEEFPQEILTLHASN